MMQEQVIITIVNINRQGERKHFQIRLPKNTKFIVGIEYGDRLLSKVDSAPQYNINMFHPNQVIGELKLQSCAKENWFYSTDVLSIDANLDFLDFSAFGFQGNDYT